MLDIATATGNTGRTMLLPHPDKFSGCLIGQCLGDALGFPVEGRDEVKCRHYVSNSMKRWFEGAEPLETEWWGQYTDDSQLARELLDSIVWNGDWYPDDYAARIAMIFRENRIVGRGIACDEAALRLNEGVNWRESGTLPPSAGNGTAMRAAPVGLFFYNDPDKMIRVAHEQGWITHKDPRCSAGSIAIAGAVALALSGETANVESFVNRLAEWMSRYHTQFAELVLRLSSWVELPPHRVVGTIAAAGKPDDYIEGCPGISPFVVGSVLWSLYAFLRYRDSYWDAISTAIAVGGDVDTTGAMTGAISGAHLGIEALPGHLAQKVNDCGEWGYEPLVKLAETCYRSVCGH